MEKKYLILIAIVFALIAAGGGLYLLTSGNSSLREKSQENSAVPKTAKNVKVVNADQIVSNPEKFADESSLVRVEGAVTNVDKPNSLFTLGCEDACIGIPVKYSGQPPKEWTRVIVYGNVRKNMNGKFFFDAKEIKYK